MCFLACFEGRLYEKSVSLPYPALTRAKKLVNNVLFVCNYLLVAIRDAKSTARYDGSRTKWSRKDVVYQCTDEGYG